ncbi:hypothetical protein, partial [Pseudofulvimonas gallinarii]|uniref:hypothetical protein n=1 Tax=Pseudofulvimonas gallinarii TaxID=634155 RepID=UPI003CCE22D3
EALRRIERGASPLRTRVSGAPRDIEAVIARAMHVDPARRYASAAAFADDLRAVLVRQGRVSWPWMRTPRDMPVRNSGVTGL